MEQLWEKKWRSFRRSEPQSAPEYSRTAHNKPILRREGEVLLRELTDSEYDRISHLIAHLDTDDLSFDGIFGDKKRIVVPFVPGPTGELQNMIEFFESNGFSIDWQNGLVSKKVLTNKGEQERKSKIGKTLNKAISLKKKHDELYNAWSAASYATNNAMQQKRAEWRDKLRSENPTLDTWSLRDLADERVKADPEIQKLQKEQDRLRELRFQHNERQEKDFRWLQGVHNLEEMLKFWNEKGNFYRQNPEAVEGEKGKYSLVITRAPIDVLRMSDFDDITSCHSPPNRGSPAGGGYYNCAVAEAQGHGPIAYVVENSEIPEDIDWEEEEVFNDDHRGTGYITPLSRVRIRKFVHNDDGYELAVPERRTYGKTFPNLVSAVTEFMRESQKEIINNPPDDVNDFTRYGGSYSDSTDGTLFNNLFQSENYAGNTHHDNSDEPSEEDVEEEDTAEVYEDQCREIDNRLNRFDHAYASYEVVDEAEPYVLMSAGIQIEFDGDELNDDNIPSGWRELSALGSKIKDNLDYYAGEIDISEYAGDLVVRIDAYTGDVEPNPDGYEYFLDNTVSELDEKYGEIYRKVREVLVEVGIMDKSAYDQVRIDLTALDDADEMYQHFSIEVDSDDEIEIVLKDGEEIPLNVNLLVPQGTEGEKIDYRAYASGGKALPPEIRKKIIGSIQADGFRHEFWTGIVRMIESAAKQMFLPGMDGEIEDEVHIRMPFEDLEFTVHRQPEKAGDGPWISQLDFSLKLTGMQDNEDVIIALRLIKYIDENYDKIVKHANQTFDKFVRSVNDTMNVLSTVMEKEQLVDDILKEIEPYQKEMRRKHPKWKKLTIGLGGNKSSGGGPFTKKPSMSRSKSAPPAGE